MDNLVGKLKITQNESFEPRNSVGSDVLRAESYVAPEIICFNGQDAFMLARSNF